MATTVVLTGKVKFFLKEKGYGFIACDDPKSGDLFFHESNTEGVLLVKGDTVSFDIEEGKKGLKAVNIHKI